MADTSKITLKQLKDAMNKAKKYTDNEIAGITGVSKVEPEELDMPKVFFYGAALPTTKDNVNLTMDYISNTTKFSSFIKLKCQGTSSMSYAKKNFTVSMFSDESRKTKLKKDFKGWGPQSKFCLKANYVDTTHTRNLSGAKVAYDMVQSRPDSPFKQQLLQCPRNGAVDGFPIKLYFNGEFYGIYTWNIPKDGWMFNMNEDNPNHCVLCAEQNNNGNMNTINSCQFRKVWNGSGDWSVEVGTASANIKASFDRCINFVMTSTDQEFKANIGDYFDLYSLLDYYCFSYLVAHIDGLAKNMLMATYDGVIWGACLYDMDSIYGVDWNGSSFKATNIQCPEQYQETNSLLWQRIESCFPVELYARYLELRQGALSLSNIIKHVEEIYDVIPDRVFADEKAKWTGLPAVTTNTMTRFRNYMRDRVVYVDAQMEEIGTKLPCTGIVLSADTLSFTTTDTQTLEAVVSPSDTTDAVVWSVSPNGVATVVDGVVTPVANGTCTITATCGTQSATCNVTVSLPVVECTGITLDKNTLQLGTIQGTAPDSTTNLLEGLTWKDGTVNDDGTIRVGTDKYAEVTITVPGVYKLSQTGKYEYLKLKDTRTVVGHPYSITHGNGNDIVFNVFDTPRTFLISMAPNNQIWNPSLVALNYESSLKESCTLFDDEQQITDANSINIRWTDTDYNYIELNLNSLIGQNKLVVKFNNVNYRIACGNAESLFNSKYITDLALYNYTLFNEWNNKTLFYFRLPIAWGSTKEEIMNYMIANQINKLVINPSDYINSLPTAGAVTKLSHQLTSTVTPDNCTQPVVWSVSPEGIVTVDNGLVTAVANGEATVTATCGTQSATCAVTVSGMSESGGDTGDYTDISYIESTGTQYINTRIVPTASTKIELVAEMSASERYDHIFGSDNFMKAQWMDETGTGIYATKKNGQNQITGLTLGKHTYVMDMADTTNAITIDGTKYGNIIGQVESTTSPLLLLCGYKIDGTIETEFCGIGKIYSCKVYYEDTLVANMKPVLTNSGTYGLLDTVNNSLYASEVGSFTGPVPPSGGDTE